MPCAGGEDVRQTGPQANCSYVHRRARGRGHGGDEVRVRPTAARRGRCIPRSRDPSTYAGYSDQGWRVHVGRHRVDLERRRGDASGAGASVQVPSLPILTSVLGSHEQVMRMSCRLRHLRMREDMLRPTVRLTAVSTGQAPRPQLGEDGVRGNTGRPRRARGWWGRGRAATATSRVVRTKVCGCAVLSGGGALEPRVSSCVSATGNLPMEGPTKRVRKKSTITLSRFWPCLRL